MTLVFLFVVILLSVANGANDNFKGMATLWGSDTLSYRRALLFANAATFAGGCVALVFGAALLKTFSGKGIVAPATLANGEFALAFSIGAAATVGLATLLRYPVSTTHAILGALAGSAFALDGSAAVFSSLFGKAFIPLLVSPLLAMGLTYFLWQAGRWTASAPVALAAGPQRNITIPFGGWEKSQFEDKGHITAGLTVCFARGVNDTPKIASILLLSQSLALSKQEIVVLIAFFMVVGGFFFSANIAEVLSKKITGMTPRQGLVGNVVTAGLVLFASKFGFGVSTTHVSVGSLFGIGALSGEARWRKVSEIVLAWVATLPCAFLVAFVVIGFLSRT